MQELTALARRVVPELASRPLYVVDADSDGLPGEFRLYGCHGLHSPWLDVGLSSWLRDRGLWQGRGPLILLNTGSLRWEAADDAGTDQAFADALFAGRLMATFSHELAHVLELPNDTTEYLDLGAASREAAAALRTYHTTDCEPAAPWHGHAADWLRLLAHVTCRVEAAIGERLPTPWLCGGCYGLTNFVAYRSTLEGEMERLAAASFATIKATPPPVEFVRLWQADVRRWFDGITEPGPAANKAFADGMALFS